MIAGNEGIGSPLGSSPITGTAAPVIATPAVTTTIAIIEPGILGPNLRTPSMIEATTATISSVGHAEVREDRRTASIAASAALV